MLDLKLMRRALVTLAIGEQYLDSWKQYAEGTWREYARRFDLDLIAITEPLDQSYRAAARSPAWQKLLVPLQPWATDYDQILWLDSDIVINNHGAGDLLAAVPVDRVGAVTDLSQPSTVTPLWRAVFHEHYYTAYGLPSDHGFGMNTGVLAYSPALAAPLFRAVYDGYEAREGNWQHEQRPLAWHIFEAGLAHSIDSRYNYSWGLDVYEHYPFLVEERAADEELIRRCMAVSFRRAYFFHFCGTHAAMRYVHT